MTVCTTDITDRMLMHTTGTNKNGKIRRSGTTRKKRDSQLRTATNQQISHRYNRHALVCVIAGNQSVASVKKNSCWQCEINEISTLVLCFGVPAAHTLATAMAYVDS